MDAQAEEYLWRHIRFPEESDSEAPRDVIARMLRLAMIDTPRQAWRTLENWSERDLYDYGVTLDMGWRVNY